MCVRGNASVPKIGNTLNTQKKNFQRELHNLATDPEETTNLIANGSTYQQLEVMEMKLKQLRAEN